MLVCLKCNKKVDGLVEYKIQTKTGADKIQLCNKCLQNFVLQLLTMEVVSSSVLWSYMCGTKKFKSDKEPTS